MDYLNCKDLPLWAQILVHKKSADESGREPDNAQETIEKVFREAAAA